MIKAAVCGANGKMGQEVVKAVINADDMELTAKIDSLNGEYSSLKEAFEKTKFDVAVDFTRPDVVFENAEFCLKNKVNTVIGTTGLSDSQLKELEKMSSEYKTGCFIAPNFSTGAVLMMKFAKISAKYFDNAEIIEFHHNKKLDAPSGTALRTAMMMSENNDDFSRNNSPETETLKGSRGGNTSSNIHIHSVRMPNFTASQEVILGSYGQTLTIRHDSTNRECYMPGVLLAVRYVMKNGGFTYGLDNILD